MRSFIRHAIFPLITFLSATFLLVACQSGDTTDSTESHSESVSETLPAETTYTITLTTSDSTFTEEMLIVKLMQNGTAASFKLVSAEGQVSFTLPTSEYTVEIESPAGERFHFPETTLTPESPSATLEICHAVSDPITLPAPSKHGSEGYVAMDAYEVGEGTTYLPLNPNDHTYVFFAPTRAGYYEISCSDGVDFAYHGMPILIYDEPRVSPIDGVIKMPVEEGSIGGDGSVTRMVFRLNPVEGSNTTEAFITIKYTGSLVKSEEELASWTILEADPAALVPYEGSIEGTLTNVDITAPAVTDKILVLGEDGYYHYGSATGPVVFLRISSDNPYTQSFAKMCETDRIRAYIYDENGRFLRKEGYSEMVLEYAEVAIGDGLVPLNDQLIYMVKSAGNYMGWWDYTSNRDIFGDLVVPPEIAWMFACAYYA